MFEPLSAFLARWLQDSRALIASVQEPVVVFRPIEPDPDEDDEFRFRTMSGLAASEQLRGEDMVFRVKKRTDNAFQRGITVGRTGNNDFVLDDPSVSRFHAWFQHGNDGFVVVDADSKNGTTLNGTRLLSKKHQPLGDEATIIFGKVVTRFYMPDAFIRFLEAKVRG